ncbi:IPT/TIG domain-containing protein [Ereboglobus luteus]|nr:IPT/TIG domain-containing protein [Ereboglobus luteus]
MKLNALLFIVMLASSLTAAPMDSTTLADFDFSDAQKARTQALIDNGTLQLERVLAAPDTGYRHVGWPVATRLPDGRTVVLIRNLRNHSGYDSYPDNARRVIYSDDMVAWQPADVLSASPALGINAEGNVASLGKYDYKGMHALSWAYPTGSDNPRLVAVTGKHDSDDTTLTAGKLFRVYLSDDRGVTWREQTDALSALPTAAVHSGPNMIRHPEFGLVVPFGQVTGSGTGKANYLASSSNAGETWQVRSWANTADSRSIEPALATWGSGHMVMIGRERTNAYGYDSVSGKYYYTQHVYAHTPGAAFSSISFTTARTNIAGNGQTPTAKGKNAYEAHDTAEVIYNPVTGRIEMIQSSRWGNGAEDPLPADPSNVDTVNNSLNIWSIDPVDLLNGGATWRFDGNIVERQGIILGGWDSSIYGDKGNKDGFHPGGSIVDEAAGKQHIFVYVGIYTQYASAYRISRPLDTYAFRVACGLPALPAPVITSVSEPDADNHVTIIGSNFTDLKEVLIADVPALIASSTDTEIKISIRGGVKVGDKIIVRTDNGITSATSGMTHPAPVVDSVSCQAVWPGNTVTITGTNLTSVNKVFFGNIEVSSFVSQTDGQIVVIVPEGVTDGSISVRAPGGIGTPPNNGEYKAAVKPFNLGELVSSQSAVTGYHPLDLVASGTGIPDPSFKWQYRPNSSADWADVGGSSDYQGAAGDHLTIVNTAGKNGWQYRYVAMNHTEDVYSNEMTLRLLAETLPAPAGITATSGTANPDLYITDIQSHTVQKITQTDWQVAAFAGQSGSAGNADGAATEALFRSPRGVAINTAGDMIIADTGNSLIRTISADGVVTTTATTFNHPRATVAHDATGDVYIADTSNHLIKKIAPDGTVTLLAGAGIPGYANGVGPGVLFNAPSGIAIDVAGNLYIADTGNNAIRYLSAVTGSVTTLAGKPNAAGAVDGAVSAATFRAPQGVAVDSNGDVFVCDTGNSLIREIHSGTVYTIAGQTPGIAGFKDGSGTNAWFANPTALVLAEDGNLYVADTGNAVIRRIDGDDNVTTLPLMEYTGTNTPPAPSPDSGGGGGGGLSWYFIVTMLVFVGVRLGGNKKQQDL